MTYVVDEKCIKCKHMTTLSMHEYFYENILVINLTMYKLQYMWPECPVETIYQIQMELKNGLK